MDTPRQIFLRARWTHTTTITLAVVPQKRSTEKKKRSSKYSSREQERGSRYMYTGSLNGRRPIFASQLSGATAKELMNCCCCCCCCFCCLCSCCNFGMQPSRTLFFLSFFCSRTSQKRSERISYVNRTMPNARYYFCSYFAVAGRRDNSASKLELPRIDQHSKRIRDALGKKIQCLPLVRTSSTRSSAFGLPEK